MKCGKWGKEVKGFYYHDEQPYEGTFYQCDCGWTRFVEDGGELDEDYVKDESLKELPLTVEPVSAGVRAKYNKKPTNNLDDAFVATNKRIDEVIDRLLKLEESVKKIETEMDQPRDNEEY